MTSVQFTVDSVRDTAGGTLVTGWHREPDQYGPSQLLRYYTDTPPEVGACVEVDIR